MNYRHAFHAGNFADCFKHALLVALVDSFKRKTTPFFVLDTHAGAGRYDLNAEPALRTAEADAGIRRLLRNQSPSLRRYLQLVESLGLYPGSPVLIRTLLRPGDALSCCELHPEDATTLRAEFHCDSQVVVHERSGWEALGSLLPPQAARGLVFIDPPFEDATEFATLADGLRRGHRRFTHGMFAAWYPIKNLASVRSFISEMEASRIRDILMVDFCRREPTDPSRLNGCGLLVINSPFGFEDLACRITNALLAEFGEARSGARAGVSRITDE
jgi:23S rRNA (adenine2030-N6)-methyltransferase